jgi:hypothetical protein
MAARKRKIRHDDNTRAKIKTSQIINRLQRALLTDSLVLSAQQVSIGLGLLRKVLPDMQSAELTGKDGERLTVVIKGSDASLL